MKLKIASNSSYSDEQLKRLEYWVGKEVTLQELIKLPVAVALVAAESDDEWVAIDHPHGW